MIFYRTTESENIYSSVRKLYDEKFIRFFVKRTKIVKPTVTNFISNNFREFSSLFHKTPYMRLYIFEYKKFLSNLVMYRRKFSGSLSTQRENDMETFFEIFYKSYHKGDIEYLFYALYKKINPDGTHFNSRNEHANTYHVWASNSTNLKIKREVANNLIIQLNTYVHNIYHLTNLLKETAMERLFSNLYGTYVVII